MARFRKIDPRVWNDEKFRRLGDHAKLVFLFILTHPHLTSVGAMRASVPGLAAELRWPEGAFRKAFEEVIAQGMIEVDEAASFIGAPNFVRYNRPESPNVVRSWSAAMDLLPECAGKAVLLARLEELIDGLGEGFKRAFAEAFGEGFAKGMPNQEQEQEQEQEKETAQVKSKTRKTTAYTEDFERWWSSYRRKVGKGEAFKAWRKLGKDRPEVEVLIAAVEKQKTSAQWTKDGGQYIPNPATWLNQSRWDDELPKVSGSGRTAGSHGVDEARRVRYAKVGGGG